MLRALSLEEVAFVSGGMFEDADSFDDTGGGDDGGFGDSGDDYSGNYNVSQDVPSPVDSNGDIIIQATTEQVAQAQAAYNIAEIVVNGIEYGSIVAGALGATYGDTDGVKALSAIAGGISTANIGENKESYTNSMADFIYNRERDGSWYKMASTM